MFLFEVLLVSLVSVGLILFLGKNAKEIFKFLKSVGRSIKGALRENEDIQRKIKDHPRLTGFLERRFDKKKFSGMPLTLFFLAFIYVLFLLGGVIEDFITSDTIVTIDQRVANLFYSFRNPLGVKIFSLITLLGEWRVAAVFIIIFSLILWLWNKRVYLFSFSITLGGAVFVNFLGKFLFNRPRPQTALYFEATPSFPSGHATLAIAFYGFIGYAIFRNAKKWKYKITVICITLILSVFIALSRLYLGVHFLSDVWCGYLLGLLWLIAGIALTEWLLSHRWHKIRPKFSQDHLKVISLGLIAIGILYYNFFALNYDPPRRNIEKGAPLFLTRH